MQTASLQIVGDTGEAIHKHQGWRACKVQVWNQLICHISPLPATLKQLKLLDATMMCVCVHHVSWLHQIASVAQDSGWQL